LSNVGLFSAPSRFEALVRDIKVSLQKLNVSNLSFQIPPPTEFTNCTIDSDSTSFLSRSFVVRYRDETHVFSCLPQEYLNLTIPQELNEGVHWRLTIPNVFSLLTSLTLSSVSSVTSLTSIAPLLTTSLSALNH
jgi:hypothetical protein